jgi:hypothetical protein
VESATNLLLHFNAEQGGSLAADDYYYTNPSTFQTFVTFQPSPFP